MLTFSEIHTQYQESTPDIHFSLISSQKTSPEKYDDGVRGKEKKKQLYKYNRLCLDVTEGNF